MRKLLSFSLILTFLSSVALAAAQTGRRVLVRFKSGRSVEAVLVAQDERWVTLSTGDGALKLPRSAIASIGAPGAPGRRAGRTITLRRPGPALLPPRVEPWPQVEEERIERLLTEYFEGSDDERRRAVAATIEKTRLGWRLPDLERMRRAAAKRGLLRHVPVPWRRDSKRGWFNIAVPSDYTPTRPWPLVLALHGMPSDGDNLVSWYNRYFPQRGYIVLCPTTIHRASYWPAPREKLELLRLLRHICHLYRLDYHRIYCTGASGGGIGTWHMLVTLPELFAAGISFSAMGTIFDERLQRLLGVPFYVHHGAKDAIPVSSVRRAVDAARRYGASVEFHVSDGTGHTPAWRDFKRAFEWLVRQPPKKTSARYILEAPEGSLPVGYPRYLPFTMPPERDTLAKTHASSKTQVRLWRLPATLAAEDLEGGLLAVAKALDPASDATRARRELDGLAQTVRARAGPEATGVELLYALNELLFQNAGFCRDGQDPSGEKPEGYAIDRVVKARKGSVFTLTAVWLLVARRLGLPAMAVVTPYHAFGRYDDGDEEFNVETTEVGGHFDDAVYRTGYGLPHLPGYPSGRGGGDKALLAAHLAALATMAWEAGDGDKAARAARLAVAAHPESFGGLLSLVLAAKEERDRRRALALLDTLAKAWPAYATPRLIQGETFAEIGERSKAIAAYRMAARAPLKPYGLAAAFDAECHYRIAAIIAADVKRALARGSLSAPALLRDFNEAILECLKRNPMHQAARKLLREMGGQIR